MFAHPGLSDSGPFRRLADGKWLVASGWPAACGRTVRAALPQAMTLLSTSH